MTKIIAYTQKLPIWHIALGILFIAGALIAFADLNIFGIVSLIFAYMLLKTEGSEIDLESKTYRKIISVLGVKIGKWQPLDQPEYISVFNTTEHITVRIVTAETTNSQPVILLNLFLQNNQKITVHRTEDAKEAFDVASHIADALNINLLDATEKGNFQWVDKDNYRTHGQILHVN
ncbi:hypothetical protein ESY86_13670 [Subsaximicrobium wynnwilliamsii]|uniref:Uncharacterized protein n=1 Tax=Subsaximicrobium wynnwilliamsii TaxID=291179 RepID=A0A5C6ZGZ3_9FLAO|nr:hypothetical protein [Subsaximicrobium wynnwilliamsii]TXD82502.1 hypothetical protein ESY87_13265 [Subsaximicrobium wynnwilliamsii]TXD88145.1 hypothetical protein ESY86_13670 [Subsaximicrobium wynnwilliamsii]TXE02160.1 hypothetical protein ESY88_12835 [Subsaximicrobium wynnwilliamsii]